MFRHRTHSNCFSSTPAACAEWGSKASHPSIRANASAVAVLAAKAESSKLVRPEQAGPKISVSAPRGKPPANESISAMPVETVSTAWRSRYVNGEATRPARASSTLERKVARFTAISGSGGKNWRSIVFAFSSPSEILYESSAVVNSRVPALSPHYVPIRINFASNERGETHFRWLDQFLVSIACFIG